VHNRLVLVKVNCKLTHSPKKIKEKIKKIKISHKFPIKNRPDSLARVIFENPGSSEPNKKTIAKSPFQRRKGQKPPNLNRKGYNVDIYQHINATNNHKNYASCLCCSDNDKEGRFPGKKDYFLQNNLDFCPPYPSTVERIGLCFNL
jgi:hypothetical protein